MRRHWPVAVVFLLLAGGLWGQASDSPAANEPPAVDPTTSVPANPASVDTGGEIFSLDGLTILPSSTPDVKEPGDTPNVPADGTGGPVSESNAPASDAAPPTTGEPGKEQGADGTDALFGGDMVDTANAQTQNTSPADDLLKSEGIVWSGSFSGSFYSKWGWNNLGSAGFSFGSPTDETLTPRASAGLGFDVRPKTDFRVFGKLRIDLTSWPIAFGSLRQADLAVDEIMANLPPGWTAQLNTNGDIEIRDPGGTLVSTIYLSDIPVAQQTDQPNAGVQPILDLSVFELFADFNWQNHLFFRLGKSLIPWGVGYFWSPADVVNTIPINPEDPSRDRQGPMSLKVQYPFGQNSLALYLIANQGIKPSELAVAPKLELISGGLELDLGAYYQTAKSPKAILTGTLTSGDFYFFGEAVASWGSDRVFVRRSLNQAAAQADPTDDLVTVLDTYEVDGAIFASTTVGIRYIHTLPEKRGTLTAVGQYYFNGEGYASSDVLRAAYYLQANPGSNGLAIPDPNAQPPGYTAPPLLRLSDLSPWGMHYAGVSFSWSNLLNTSFGVSAYALANLSDGSGIFYPKISCELFDRFTLTMGMRMTFGAIGTEYANPPALVGGTSPDPNVGRLLAFTLEATLDGGKF